MEQYDLSTISSGVDYIKNGYIDYSEEVIRERALPDFFDGLKPVNRRIIYTLFRDKVKNFKKSGTLCGDTLALHPHGDSAIYQAMVLMTQLNGSLAFPLVHGKGNFGGVYKTDPPAAMRYTEVKLHDNLKEYFGEMNGVQMVPNFDATTTEPVVCPVSFPAVLVNATSGIAVGFSSNLASFNFVDVCNLVIEYIRDGSCHTVIEPDFVTGGYYVRNEKELQKLMRAGKCKLKLRAKTYVDGKRILVSEVPYGRTIQRLLKQINDLNLPSVSNAYDKDDFDGECLFAIQCTTKNRVDEAFYQILKKTDLQYSFSANMTVIVDGAPRTIGVWTIIELWVAKRKEILAKEYNEQVANLKQTAREARAFMTIVKDEEKKRKLVNIITDRGTAAGRQFIEENFTREEVAADLISLCASRSLPSYYDGGKYRTLADTADNEISELEYKLSHLDEVIIKEQERLIRTYGATMKRRTEVTTKDYEFVETADSQESAVDNSPCSFEYKNGFLKKLRSTSQNEAEYKFGGYASDTLIALDNRGRILRVYCQDLPYSAGDLGTYLPSYFGFDNEADDYRIIYLGKLDGKVLTLLYKDGNIGFIDTNEWMGNSRNVKVIQKGYSLASAPSLGAVIDTPVPSMLYVMDAEGRVAWAMMDNVKHKDRTARTRVFDLYQKVPLAYYGFVSAAEGSIMLENLSAYEGKLRYLETETSFKGDSSIFKPYNL